jgi:putative nucleotidyltransferase with HDIG domain
MTKYIVPKEIVSITEKIKNEGFEAYLVGGCVRDMLRGVDPKDWDIATNAKPEKIVDIFPHTFYENRFGTVGVVNDGVEDKSLETVEVTTYRLEKKYSDSRHPDEVKFSEKLEDDLKRRDFTINAMAIDLPIGVKDISKGHLVDEYKGQKDLKDKVIRTVLEPEKRFTEDILRIMRAVRFATELGFTINTETANAIKKFSGKLKEISKERIRDEFVKIINSPSPKKGLTELQNLGLLIHIIPELEKGIGIEQPKAHAYDVWEHSVRTVQAAADKKFSLEVRLAALLHDIAKPKTRRHSKDKNKWTFYGHDVVGARVSRRTLNDLRFPKEITEKVTKLIRWHMFFSDTEQITPSAVRRLIKNVGQENVWDLVDLRICDRVGTGRPKEEPYRLRKYQAMIEEVIRDPISVGMLKIDGNRIMSVAKMKPGPKIGYILHALLEEVLDDPKLNTTEYLGKRVLKLAKLDDYELIELGERGKMKKEEKEGKEIKGLRDKRWVK